VDERTKIRLQAFIEMLERRMKKQLHADPAAQV